MIYTCYEMIADCREGKNTGWKYFVVQYLPAIRAFLAHYFPERTEDAGLAGRVLEAVRSPESPLFRSLDPAPERAFLAELRQQVLRAVEADQPVTPPDIVLELPVLAEALTSLTMVEMQSVWMEAMRYDTVATGRILHVSPQTVEKKREQAAGLLRAQLDTWRRTLLAENGFQLGWAAAAAASDACLSANTFFDAMDGRITWRARQTMETHAAGCLHCVDHFCRLLEVADLARTAQPLREEEAAGYLLAIGIEAPKPAFWKRVLTRQTGKLC